MSQAQFGGFPPSFAIHTDGAENACNIGLRKTKGGELQGKPPASKRAALGTITNTTRVQPSRAAKQGPGQEGFCGLQQNENLPGKAAKSVFPFGGIVRQPQLFGIHVDDHGPQPVNQVTQAKSDLHPDISALRLPLSTLQSISVKNDSSPEPEDSPMLLDISLDKSIKHDVEDNEQTRLNKICTVPEYADDIYRYLREAELRNRAKSGYMKKQPDITTSMRSILVDWLVEVSEEYKLHRETLCLSVNYIDRFLSQMSVLRGKLQLVGAASMFLAAKYEEIYPPEVGEFVYITDDTYTKKQVLRMEHLVLKVLSFDVAVPTINCFCEKFLKDQEADDKTKALAMYLVETTLLDADTFLKYVPSVTAAASICLANQTLGNEPWSEKMVQSTGYEMSDFQACLQDEYVMFCRAAHNPQQAVREKYKHSKYHGVSQLSPPSMLMQTVTVME